MRPTALGLLAVLALTACASTAPRPTGPGTVDPGSDVPASSSGNVRMSAVSAPFSAPPGSPAVTYVEDLVPVGAGVSVSARSAGGSTTVELEVRGLRPEHRFGAHAHAEPCGPTGEAAGPHHQQAPDPVQPSVDPAFANPENEIWLDLATGADGAGRATSTVAWEPRDDRRPRSVVLHEQPTATGPGEAGTAGARVACVSLDS